MKCFNSKQRGEISTFVTWSLKMISYWYRHAELESNSSRRLKYLWHVNACCQHQLSSPGSPHWGGAEQTRGHDVVMTNYTEMWQSTSKRTVNVAANQCYSIYWFSSEARLIHAAPYSDIITRVTVDVVMLSHQQTTEQLLKLNKYSLNILNDYNMH